MKRGILLIVYTLGLFISSCTQKPHLLENNELTKEERLNNDWVLQTMDGETSQINLPHSPRIEPLLVNDQWQGELIYTKIIEFGEDLPHKTFIHFEGIMNKAVVYINDVKIKTHIGGYLPFTVDLSKHIHSGTNELKIAVSNYDHSEIPPGKALKELDFNYYGGIYRDVWLINKNDLFITDSFLEDTKEAGWLIHFNEVTNKNANGLLRLQLRNESALSKKTEIKVKISNESSNHTFKRELTIPSDSALISNIEIDIPTPKLWSIYSPHLYDLKIEVLSEGKIVDIVEDKIGIRKIELSDKGFMLNGDKIFIRGTNRHQEYPYVGYAISNNANYRDALKIKNAGFDFVRLSHYPQDESFLDACDELGLLVMNAIPGWQYFQEGPFSENSFQNIKDMVRRDRNHPSLAFWEVSLNESNMSEEYMVRANKILKEELPFEDTYSAGWIDHSSYDIYIPARQHGQPPNYWNNYKEGKRNLIIAEYGDWEYYAHNAGFNQSSFKDLSAEDRNSRQLRGAGEVRLLQQAMNFQEAANSNRRGKSTIGHANWLMFDYNRGYADDLEASGISDIFRLPKFANYFYRSQRPPDQNINHPLVDDGAFIKIASYWTPSSPTRVRVYSNCEEVELYLNDSLISRKLPEADKFSDQLNHPPFEFELDKFRPGNLRAVGLIDGIQVTSDTVFTPTQVKNISVVIDSVGNITNEIDDILFVYAKVIDSNDNIVPTFNGTIIFSNEGDGELIGENPVPAVAGIATILFKGDPTKSKISAIFKNYKNQ